MNFKEFDNLIRSEVNFRDLEYGKNDDDFASSDAGVLFVCSSNQIISPIAEAVFNENSPETAVSAGLYLPPFSEMPFASIRLCQNHGLDISGHEITHVSDVSMEGIGVILAATCEIRDILKTHFPDFEIFTIKEYSGCSSDLDIEDPLGGTFDDYENCFRQIEEAVLRIVECRREIIAKPVQIRNFRYLDDLIHTGVKEIILDGNIVQDYDETGSDCEVIIIDEDNVTIDGNGFDIDAGCRTSILAISGDNITLKNIVFKNSKGVVAKIRNESKCTFVNCNFEGNASDFHSSDSLIICNGFLELTECNFISNSYAGPSPKMWSPLTYIGKWGSIIFIQKNHQSDDGFLKISNCSFEDNHCEYGVGIVHSEVKTEILDSVFENNTALCGGAMYIGNPGIDEHVKLRFYAEEDLKDFVDFKINNTKFFKNDLNEKIVWGIRYSYVGGAIFLENVRGLIEDCEFSSNGLKSNNLLNLNRGILEVLKCTFKSNHPKSELILNNRGELSINKSEFLDYHADYGYVVSNRHIVFCNDSTFKNNDSAGVLLNETSYKENSSFNFKDDDMGVFGKSNLSVFNSKFINNSSKVSAIVNWGKVLSIDRLTFSGNCSDREFCADLLNGSTLNIKKIKFMDSDVNRTILNEGEIDIMELNENGFEEKIENQGTINDYTKFHWIDNDFSFLDRLIHESDANHVELPCDVRMGLYERNFYEGGIEIDIDNLVIDGKGRCVDASKRSRIFLITAKNVTLKNIVFKNARYINDYYYLFNDNIKGGGAIRILDGASLSLEHCEFLDNGSDENGGCISNLGKLDVCDSKFENNFSYGEGSAINNYQGEISVSSSTFVKNKSESNSSVVFPDSLQFRDCEFKVNNS